MTQQINLYAREVEERSGPLLVTIFGLVAFAVLLGLYAYMLRARTATMETRLKQLNAQLVQERDAMKQMRDALAQRTDPVRVAAELAALKSRAAESQDLVDRLNRGELGTLDGFTPHLTALAGIGEPGVWVTNVKIQNSGRTFEVDGRSLEAEAVLRYASAVHKQVSPLGASITALELAPVSSGRNNKAVAFKLF